jgi:tryptophan synthase alpha chain
MNNRLTKFLSGNRHDILSLYYTAGFPNLKDTVSIGEYLEQAGADIIEIGIPFSDPIADGPTVQEANKIALDSGMNLHLLLDQVRELREKVTIPIILMGYLNPVMQYGVEKFMEDAATAGVDGLILPDMPMEEYLSEYKDLFKANKISNTFLISPTTSEERIKKIDSATDGFIYAVSASSTTGARKDFTKDQESYFKKLKDMNLKNPFLIGFGISDNATFSKACNYGSGAIVGSSFITILKNSKDLKADIFNFVKNLKGIPSVV